MVLYLTPRLSPPWWALRPPGRIVGSMEPLALWLVDSRLEQPMDCTPDPLTRRSFLRGSLLASLAAVASLGALPIPDVAAKKNTGKKVPSIKSRVNNFQELCEKMSGGKMSAPIVRPGGTTVTCSGAGGGMNKTCTFTKQGQRCHAARTVPDVSEHTLEPESPVADPVDAPVHPLEQDGDGVVLT